jgi:hypothetical protein
MRWAAGAGLVLAGVCEITMGYLSSETFYLSYFVVKITTIPPAIALFICNRCVPCVMVLAPLDCGQGCPDLS